MCGITLAVALTHTLSDRHQALLQTVSDHMRTRGPDSSGFWVNAQCTVAMAHRRLAIQDLSPLGHQPMHYAQGRYTVVFNGEIYNFPTLRDQLSQLGHTFHSGSDTEVILASYAHYGEQCVQHFRGMFALAIFDAVNNTLFIARDPFGIKPLYYRVAHIDGGTQLWLASQVKALATLPAPLTPDPAGQVGFQLWGHLPDPFTLHREIRAVPAGHCITLPLNQTTNIAQSGRLATHAFLDLAQDMARVAETAPSQLPPETEWREILRDAMDDTLRAHLIADVPVGVFLSAGLDSTTLAALAREHTGDLHTLTLGFEEYRDTDCDEVPLASAVAGYLQTRHQAVWIGKRDFEAQRSTLLQAMDQPSIDGINTFMVCKAAQQAGLKVALSGLGGDELFGTYPSFRSIPKWVSQTRRLKMAGGVLRQMAAPWIGEFTSPKAAGMFEYGHTYEGAYLLRRGLYMPWELENRMDPATLQAGLEELDTLGQLRSSHAALKDSRLKVSLMEAMWYMRNQLLRDADWASMAHSVELRVPLVDIELWRRLVPYLNAGWGIQKTDMARVPAIRLPSAVMEKRKTGFTVPVKQWVTGLAEADGERGARAWAGDVVGMGL